MTTMHAITLAFSIVGFPAFLLSRRKNSTQNSGNHWLEQLRLDRNPYQSLRFLAITTPPYKYSGIQVDSVYGVIMDYPNKNGTATLATYSTGECSLYMSNGSGIINGERHESVRQAAFALVDLAARNLRATMPTTRYPSATSEYVRFYVLTNEGVRTLWFKLGDLNGSNESAYVLFTEANKVIRALQLSTMLN